MGKFKLPLLLLIAGIFFAAAPLSAETTETIFNIEYIGQPVDNVINNEGQPDETGQDLIIYRHKVLDGREFTIRYDLDGKTVDAISFKDNAYENVPAIEPETDWTWLSDMGKTKTEIMARWRDRPQWYYYARKNIAYGRLAEEYNMTYHNVNVNGRLYSINYFFYNNKVIVISAQTILPVSDENETYLNAVMAELMEIMDKPVWTRRIAPTMKHHQYYLADEQYLVSMDGNPERKEVSILSITVWSCDTNYAPAYIMLPFIVGSMLQNWERDDVEKGGDYAKLVKVEQKIITQMEEVNENMPTETKKGLLARLKKLDCKLNLY